MRAKVISAVLLLQMLFHSVFGCCWHHLHADEHSCHHASANAEVNGDKDHQCQHHHKLAGIAHQTPESTTCEAGANEPSDQVPETPSPCEEGRCVYFASSSLKVWQASDLWVSWEQPSTVAQVCLLQNFAAQDSGPVDSWCRVLSPVERCAQLQAWLI